MKIAATYQNGQVFGHFGHTEQFKLYLVEEGKIVESRVVDTNGSGHGALADFLKALGVEKLICGGIGMGARIALAEAGIEIFGGVAGDADEAAAALAAGSLAFDPNAKCDHHGEGHDHHHGEGHECGGHCHDDHECGGHCGK